MDAFFSWLYDHGVGTSEHFPLQRKGTLKFYPGALHESFVSIEVVQSVRLAESSQKVSLCNFKKNNIR